MQTQGVPLPLYSVNTAGASRLLGSPGWSLPWGLGRAEPLAPGHGADTWPLAVEMKGHVGRTAGICGVVTWGSKGACSPRLLSSKALDRDCQRTAPSLSPTRPLRSPVHMMPRTDGYRKSLLHTCSPEDAYHQAGETGEPWPGLLLDGPFGGAELGSLGGNVTMG